MSVLMTQPVHISSAPNNAHPMTMSRSSMSIDALLRPDSAETQVQKFGELGRTYYRHGQHVYMFPADDNELERLDIVHRLIYTVALNKQLHIASFTTTPRRILDIGFGDGYWMLEMRDRYPSTEIIGLDLVNDSQPPRDRNCQFQAPVDFNAPTWPIEDSSVDLVHMAQLCGCVPDWVALYRKAYRSLRPGTGQVEHIEIDWKPRTSAREFPAQGMDLLKWWEYTLHASQMAGKSLEYRDDTEDLLEQAGFVDISHKRFRVPLYVAATKDKRETAFAHAYQMAMGYQGSQSFTAFSMSLFTRVFGWPAQSAAQTCAAALAVIQGHPLPLYINLHVWTARRPQS
ncbi:hypothetical protein AC578_3836 [Pseudocercospora eumusae]|uniref:Methyltransferase domain-containing protein n=1 Tax=Pseudocercospora eumusae TaxID=321146 RepID=A0A139GXT6_9PEZI|nr:hypothetical protein AC578_3836 [Pseudocercospora eumusae]